MKRIKERICRCCTELFSPDYRNAKRQEYCAKPECRKASKVASQQKWLANNPDFFKGSKTTPMAVQNLFRLQFVDERANVIFLGTVGLGKTHLATALGYTACLAGKSVLFVTAVDAINTLAAAQAANRLKAELKKYLAPSLLILDELGYLPIDKHGADLLFQIISQRYERGATIITSNRAYKQWPEIFNNDSTLTSAFLDRLLHHAETMLLDGKSYRMKDQIEG